MKRKETNCGLLDEPATVPVGELIFESEVLGLAGGISRITLWRWIRAGRFPKPLAWPGKAKVWRRADVMAYLAQMPTK